MAVQIEHLSAVIAPSNAASANSDYWFVQPLASEGTYRRRPPFALFDEDAMPSTRSTARLHSAIVRQSYPPLHMVGLRDASVLGQGAVLTRSGKLVWESVREFTSQNMTPDGFHEQQGGLALKELPKRTVETPCLLAKRPWYRNYGHWLVDNADLIALLAETICREGLTIVIGQYAGPMATVIRDTLDIICPAAQLMVLPDDEVWRFSELRYVTPLHVPPLFKFPPALAALRQRVLGGDPPGGRARLFITRGAHPSRVLTNEDEIFEAARARGFVRVQPEHLAFREQAMLFATAEAVMGVKGAALTNCMFCSPDTKVIVMSPDDFPDPFFWDICGQMDLQYGEIYGRSAGEGPRARHPFTIDAHRISELLDLMLGAATGGTPPVPGSGASA